jgi:hypothetical protein
LVTRTPDRVSRNVIEVANQSTNICSTLTNLNLTNMSKNHEKA